MPPSLRTLSALPDYSRREAARSAMSGLVPAILKPGAADPRDATIPPAVARKVRKILVAVASSSDALHSTRENARQVIINLVPEVVASGLPVEPAQVYMGPARLALEALSHILAPYGYGEVRDMEGETPLSCKGKTVYDLNTGDSYRTTVCYCDGRWYVATPAYFLGD